ncbi:MAG TPA: Asp/Glu racemase [Casimicrobiaceae bacterium]|jgi:maleate isomerase|nr:Asp/Glu racemase [Casimicrobiaceae bacterium]
MRFVEDGDGYKARIGLVYIASSVVMEAEMYAMAASGVSIHTSRVKLPSVTVDGIDRMMRSPELEESVRLLAAAPLDSMCFGGTSASFLHGTSWDQAYLARLRDWAPGIPATTTASAVLQALAAIKAGPVTLVTPYTPDIIERGARFLAENGHPVVASSGMDITSDHELARVPLERIYDLAIKTDVPESTAIFISCTNLRSVGAIAALEEALGKPVISAVQASFWRCLDLIGVDGAKRGYGSLVDRRAAPDAPSAAAFGQSAQHPSQHPRDRAQSSSHPPTKEPRS